MKEFYHAWALAYLRAGWCVLPARDKRPIFSWEEYKHRLPTEEEIDEWFSDPGDGAQMCVITGAVSGITVIDIDVKDIDDAMPAQLIADKFGLFTITQITPSGGMHLFCRYDPVIKNGVKRVHRQIDTRNDGGLVIIHPSLGYEWSKMTPWGVENIGNMADFPPILKDRIIKAQTEGLSSHDWSTIFRGISTGGRNDAAAKIIGKILRSLVLDYQKDEVTRLLPGVWDLLSAWNTMNRPPLPDWELRNVFKSITKRGL